MAYFLLKIQSVEDALRDLGIEVPAPPTQNWHFNTRMPRYVPADEQFGEYTTLVLSILHEGSEKDGLVFKVIF